VQSSREGQGRSREFFIFSPYSFFSETVAFSTPQISALAIFAEMSASLASEGKTLSAQLEALYDKHVSSSFFCPLFFSTVADIEMGSLN
jgi:hypothetical protein